MVITPSSCQTAFARFGIVTHYAYKKLKMSGPNVVIILGNIERSHKTQKTTLVLAVEAEAMALAKKEIADMRTKVNKD